MRHFAPYFMITVLLVVGCTVNVNQPKVSANVDTKVVAKADVAIAASDAPEAFSGQSAQVSIATPMPIQPGAMVTMYDACGGAITTVAPWRPPVETPGPDGMVPDNPCHASYGPVPPDGKIIAAGGGT